MVEIEKVIIKVGNKKLKASLEELNELRGVLNNLFINKLEISVEQNYYQNIYIPHIQPSIDIYG